MGKKVEVYNMYTLRLHRWIDYKDDLVGIEEGRV